MNNLGETTSPGVFMHIRGIVFDCDGVLLDSLRANTWFYNAIRAKFGLGPMSAEDETYVHAHHVYESLRRILPGDLYDKAVAARRDFDYRDVLPHLRTEPGLMDFLSWLAARPVRMGINTSRTDTMDLVASHLGFQHYFNPIVTSFKVRNPKPHPESLYHILEMWRMKPGDIVFIGDSSVDQGTADRAGVRFWAYKNPALKAALHVPSFQALKAGLMRAERMGVFPA